jgi:hypothetical protein
VHFLGLNRNLWKLYSRSQQKRRAGRQSLKEPTSCNLRMQPWLYKRRQFITTCSWYQLCHSNHQDYTRDKYARVANMFGVTWNKMLLFQGILYIGQYVYKEVGLQSSGCVPNELREIDAPVPCKVYLTILRTKMFKWKNIPMVLQNLLHS